MSPVTTVSPNTPETPEDTSLPCISVQDLSDYLGRDLSSDDGATLAVDAACDVCRTVAEQSFDYVRNDSILMDGPGTDALLLPELPVISVSSVTSDGTAVTDYALKENGVLLRKVLTAQTATAVWPLGRQNVRVIYSHGYPDGVPNDVKMVARAIASRLVIQGVAVFESLGQQSVRYGVNSTDLTAGERAILRRYKRAR